MNQKLKRAERIILKAHSQGAITKRERNFLLKTIGNLRSNKKIRYTGLFMWLLIKLLYWILFREDS